jgi:hypothetical protein
VPVIVPQDGWSKGSVIVEITIPIRVPQIRSLSPLESQFRLDPARKRHDSTGNVLTVVLKCLL